MKMLNDYKNFLIGTFFQSLFKAFLPEEEERRYHAKMLLKIKVFSKLRESRLHYTKNVNKMINQTLQVHRRIIKLKEY